jgi:pimeloyl-ACP methyl ester carboxylesterase
MLGAVQTFAQGNNEQENWRQSYYGLYAQDSYRMRPNLTLNFGVRWEPYLPAADRYHRGSHFDPAAFAAGMLVLLCHGFTGTPQSMRPWGEYLSDRGYSVSIPLLPGHGTTWQEMNQTRWEDCRCAFAGKLLEVHDQAVDRQETGVLTRLDES